MTCGGKGNMFPSNDIHYLASELLNQTGGCKDFLPSKNVKSKWKIQIAANNTYSCIFEEHWRFITIN